MFGSTKRAARWGLATALGVTLAFMPTFAGAAGATTSMTAESRISTSHSDAQATNLATSVTDARSTNSATDFRIEIVRGSNINLVSTQSRVPIQIRNNYDTDIKVLIWARPSNARIAMPKAIAFTAPANTTSNATIPVEAIANGEVRLNVWLTSFSGVPIGHPTVLNMTVQRDIEGSILIGFFVVVGTLGFIGGRRMLKRRREVN